MKMKFDREKIDSHIEVFKDNNNRDPYIICNLATYDMLPERNNSTISVSARDLGGVIHLSSGRIESTSAFPVEKPKVRYIMYGSIKVFIDDDLPTGEVILA